MKISKQLVAGAVAATAMTAGAVALAPAAQATRVDTDRPKITERHFDFGKNWSVGAPRNGGYLYWDIAGGVTSVQLEGYLYLTDRECGRVRVDLYDNALRLVDSDYSVKECAPGNGKTQWWKTLDAGAVDAVQAIVRVQKYANGTYTDQGTSVQWLN